MHAENLGRLASMSHEEKMKAQKELLSKLDPSTVAFLRSRRKLANSDSSRKEHVKMASGDCVPGSKDDVHIDVLSGTKQQMLEGTKASEQKINVPVGSTADTSEAADAQVPPLDEEELPIKPSEAAQKWVHMDDVEKDKLQWMTMLPPVKAPDPKDAAAPCVGRFDFDGELVPPDQEVPVHRGLHHHGDNPEMAGYSTAEILRLLRSQVRSQRLLALQLLERMLTKHWLGHYVGRLEGGDLLTQLLQSGLAPLVRSALDDRATVDAALAVLQALLISQPEQALFSRAFLWRHGHHLVQALLRMDLLQRLYYVLKMFRPGASCVASALLVMARLARHSTEAATKILNHPYLMNLIFEEFLPEHWNSPAYGNPMWPALELVRTIAAAGKELADTLMQRHRLGQCLAAYLALEPSASQLPTTDCLNLALEALRTWRILLTYGLGRRIVRVSIAIPLPFSFFRFLCSNTEDLYSVIARRLQLFSALDLDGVPFDLEYGAHLLHCLALLPTDTARSCLAGLGVALNMVSKRWLTLLARATDLRSVQMGVYTVAAMLHCLSSMWKLGETTDTSVVGTVLLVLNSQLVTLMTSQLRSFSLLLSENERSQMQSDSSSSQCLPCVASEEPIPFSVLASTITPTGTTPCILIPPEFPEFWPGSPATWLLKMEAAFCLRNILQQERYAIMVDILPPSLRCVVPPPGPQPYDRLRDFVLALPQPTVPRHSLPAMRNVSIAPRAVTTPAPNPVAHSTSALLTIVPSTLPTSAAATPTTVPASTTAAPASLNFRASRFMPTSTPTDLPASIPAEAMSATEVLVDTAPVFLESTVVTTESAQPAGLTAPSLPSTASTETPSHGAPLNPCAGPFSLLVTSPVVSTTGLPNQEQSNAPTASTRARSTVPVEPRAQTLTFSPPEATSTASLPVTTDAPSSRFTETTINWTVATTSAQIYSGSDCSSRKEDPTGDDYGSICPWPSAAACGQGLLCNANVKAYLEQLCSQAKHWTRRCSQRWLCRPEFNLLFELLLLAASETLDEDDAALYHEVSLTLLCTSAPGFEHQYLEVLEEVAFAGNLACSQSSQSETLSIEDVSASEIESITGCSMPVAASAKLDSAALSDIKAACLKTLETILRQINQSSAVSLTLRMKPAYSYDWLYVPLHRLCALEEITKNYDRGHVLSCLRWAIHLLGARHHFMRTFPPLVHFTRLASVFLAGKAIVGYTRIY
ncbi:hypothetical protein MRX96_047981 [Rhipicephalus microplus]